MRTPGPSSLANLRPPFEPGNKARSKLTPLRHKIVIEALQNCAHPEVAAGLAGVRLQTIENWAKRGRRRDASPEERQFYEDFVAATAGAEYKLVLRVLQDPETDSAKWLLQKRFKDRWHDKHMVDVTSGGKPLPAPVAPVLNVTVSPVVDVRRMTLADLQQLHAIATKYAPEPARLVDGERVTPEGRAGAPDPVGANEATSQKG